MSRIKVVSDWMQKMGHTLEQSDAIQLKLENVLKQQVKDANAGLFTRTSTAKKEADKSAAKPEAVRSAAASQRQALFVQARGSLVIPDGTKPVRARNPGLRGIFKNPNTKLHRTDPTCAGGETFDVPADAIAVAHTTDDPTICFVQAYKQTVDPKGKKTRKKIDNGEGYCRRSAIQLEQSFKAVAPDAPLFALDPETGLPAAPSAKNIKQGALGDCFLLAGLGSIVQREPAVIQRAILDNGDGTVTVRLFDKAVTPEGPKFTPKFITIDKSVLESAEGEHAKDSLWVQMLEKAYAVHSGAQGHGSYVQLDAGGQSHDIFEALLGRPSQAQTLPSSSKQLESIHAELDRLTGPGQITAEGAEALKVKLREMGAGDEVMKHVNRVCVGQEKERNEPEFMAANLVCFDPLFLVPPGRNASKELKAQYQKKVEDLQAKYQKVVEDSYPPERKAYLAFKRICDAELKDPDAISMDQMVKLMKTPEFSALPEEAQKSFAKNSAAKFPGASGSGNYTQSQEKLWEQMEKSLDVEGCVAMGTRKSVGFVTGTGYSAGEEKSHGLVGGHAYAIMGLAIPGPNEKDPELAALYVPTAVAPVRYVRVRNPWGDGAPGSPAKWRTPEVKGDEHGRKYLQVTDPETGGITKLIPSATHEGEFYMELTDLTNRCDNLYATDRIPVEDHELPRAAEIQLKRELRAKVKKLLEKYPVLVKLHPEIFTEATFYAAAEKFMLQNGPTAASRWAAEQVAIYTGELPDY